MGADGGTINVTNSTLEFNNGGTGGLNVNTGTVVLSNSTIKGDGRNWGALFGAQSNGSIVFGDNCLVETPGKSSADNGAGQTGKNFVVTGGSYLVKYAPDYNSSYGSTIPTNGAVNGDEQLSLFTLADSSITSLTPINKNGKSYNYSVKTASSDGEKHVWVPAAKVTFKLNADDADQKVDASYVDGSTADKTSLAMRGFALGDAKSVGGGSVALPDDPLAASYKFAGWFYKDADGNVQKFSDAVPVSLDIPVYAKWESDSSSYAVKFHNGDSSDVTYLSTSSDPSRSIKVLSADAVMKANPSFARSGKIFKGWNTKADGTGEEVAAESSLAVPAGTDVVDLYAVWEDQTVTVRFSANGGTFSDESVFKQNPAVFEISKDENGGDVATVKSSPKVSDKKKLGDLLQSLSDGKVSASTVGIATSSKTDNDPAYAGIATYKYHVLANKKVTSGWFFPQTDYYYWFNDPSGESHASYKDSNDQDVVLSQDVTYYLKWNDDPSVEQVSANSSLPSDMWGDSSKDTTSIKEVTSGDTFSLTGAVDASGIVDQMDSLENDIAGSLTDLTQISLSDTASSFTATITLPDGVVVPDKPKVSVNGLGDCFEVTETSVNGQTITVTFGLKGTYEYYKQLKDAVSTVGNGGSAAEITKPTTVTLDGLSLDADKVTNGEELAATGSVSGSFSSYAAYAENTASGKVKKYSYSWDGNQIQVAKDPRGDGIQQTLLVVKPTDQTLPADILVGNETEHENTYPMVPGQALDFTSTIVASVVKGQMKGIESQFPGVSDYADIQLSDLLSSFTATFTIPDGMSFPKNLTKDSVRLDGFADTFSVTDVSVSGKTATVTMKLKDGIKTYADRGHRQGKLYRSCYQLFD